MMRFGLLHLALSAAAAVTLVCATIAQAALVIEPVFNRVDGSGQADNNFPIYDPTFLIDGVAYFNADEPGEIISYASGDPRDPFLDMIHVWNNTQYDITGLTLRLIGTATNTENPGTIVRGPVDAVWGDVNGDTLTGQSDIFATIVVSTDGKEIRFQDGLIPVDGRFTDIHLAMSDHPPSFTGILVPEPETLALFALAAFGLVLAFRRARESRFALRVPLVTSIVIFVVTAPTRAAMYFVGNVPELIAAIDAANQNGEPDSIALAAGATFTLTDVNSTASGSTGLPTILAGGDLTIFGNGGVIERSAAAETPAFRLFDVAAGASLALQNLTLQGGYTSPFGGAIFNAGALALMDVTIQNNAATGRTGYDCRCRTSPGGPGGPGQGGGIYSSGSVHLENSVLRNNQARGGRGGSGPGGLGRGGTGTGGGLYTAAGTATLLGSFVTGNVANGGNGSPSGSGYGGGIYIASAQVDVDEFTLAHASGNTASTNYPNIFGPFDLIQNSNPFPGDFNHDGTVDAADYVVWRNGLGTAYTQNDYNTWRAHFGQTTGSGATANSDATNGVPEPSTALLSIVAWIAFATSVQVRGEKELDRSISFRQERFS